MNSMVIGATAGLGRALCERLAAAGHDIILVASDPRDLDATASDIRFRYSVSAHTLTINLRTVDPAQFRTQVLETAGTLDNIFLIAGMYADNDNEPLPDSLANALATVNFLTPLRLINSLLHDIDGNLVGVGSIAEIRPRRQSMIYGASKKGLGFYFEALRHRYQDNGPNIQYYRAGYMDTSMTFGKALRLPAVSPDYVATAIVRRLGKGSSTKYAPWWWAPIAWIYALIPWHFFKNMKG